MYVPSNATPAAFTLGPPTEEVPRIAPVLASNFVRVPSFTFETQMFAPSNATSNGETPTGKVPSIVPSLTRILLTVPGVRFVLWLLTQRFAPSKANPPAYGLPDGPAAYVPTTAPVAACSSVTVLLPLGTHMCAPSKATEHDAPAMAKTPSVAPSLARTFVTVLSWPLTTHMLAPSYAMPQGPFPTVKMQVPTHAPSLARSLVTVSDPRFANHMFAPSKARKSGSGPRFAVNRAEIFPGYQARSAISSGLLGLCAHTCSASSTTATTPAIRIERDFMRCNLLIR